MPGLAVQLRDLARGGEHVPGAHHAQELQLLLTVHQPHAVHSQLRVRDGGAEGADGEHHREAGEGDDVAVRAGLGRLLRVEQGARPCAGGSPKVPAEGTEPPRMRENSRSFSRPIS